MRVIGTGCEAGLDRAAWRNFANTAAAAFGCQLVTVEMHKEHSPQETFLVAGGLDGFEEVCQSTLGQREDDVLWKNIRDQPAGTIRLGSEIISPDAMHRNRLYAAMAMPWHLEHFMVCAITRTDGVRAYFTLGRTGREPGFVAADKDLVGQLLLPHLNRSISIHAQLDALRGNHAAYSAALDQSPYGLILFDGRALPILINQEASAVLTAGDGLTLRNGALHTEDPAIRAELARTLSVVLRAGPARFDAPPIPVLVPRTAHPQPYQVMFSPVKLHGQYAAFPTGSAVMVRILAGRRVNPLNVAVEFESTYSLSRAEVRLCQALLQGKTLAEAASTLDISRNTAKTHLARVFDKTGVHSQAALLRLLALRSEGSVTVS